SLACGRHLESRAAWLLKPEGTDDGSSFTRGKGGHVKQRDAKIKSKQLKMFGASNWAAVAASEPVLGSRHSAEVLSHWHVDGSLLIPTQTPEGSAFVLVGTVAQLEGRYGAAADLGLGMPAQRGDEPPLTCLALRLEEATAPACPVEETKKQDLVRCQSFGTLIVLSKVQEIQAVVSLSVLQGKVCQEPVAKQIPPHFEFAIILQVVSDFVRCLPSSAQQKNLTQGGESYPLGIRYDGALASQLASRLVHILIEEELGYSVARQDGDSHAGMYALMGCTTDGTCIQPTRQHINMAVWMTPDLSATFRDIHSERASEAPVSAGSMGHFGLSKSSTR
ncbi:unnamed protein product, partial [Symbiodinium microadriaticum]